MLWYIDLIITLYLLFFMEVISKGILKSDAHNIQWLNYNTMLFPSTFNEQNLNFSFNFCNCCIIIAYLFLIYSVFSKYTHTYTHTIYIYKWNIKSFSSETMQLLYNNCLSISNIFSIYELWESCHRNLLEIL